MKGYSFRKAHKYNYLPIFKFKCKFIAKGSGTIACGDAFIASSKKKQELIARFGADAVEMEGAAIAQVCRQFDVPVIIIRSISDSADEEAQTTLEGFYKTAAENSARFVMEMLTLLQ